MERRDFIFNSALFAVAVTSSGFISFNGKQYVGDCETTTDILGPFYRPDSPLRGNLVIPGEPGEPITLSGTIKHKDCKTPHTKAKVEIWHCDSKGVYDNSTDEYRYRGTVYTDEQGQYSFKTILPVPYEIGGGRSRPAHFHMMVTAPCYQSLVTQLYFTGDKHLAADSSASSPTAKNRVLAVQNDGGKKVVFDVSMSDSLEVEATSINKLGGIYVDPQDAKKTSELFVKNNQLWLKNEVYGTRFNYLGDNTFQWPETAPGVSMKVKFEMLPSGSVKANFIWVYDGKTEVYERVKGA